MSLTPQQQRFVTEYLMDSNGKQAAIRAGYSARTADQQASRLLKNVKVQALLNRTHAASIEKLELTAASITARLLTIADKCQAMDTAPGMSVARASLMDAAKLNGLVVDSSEVITRSPEERAARLASLRAERERIARAH